MNIFYLHKNPRKCARYHLDRHVVKMIIELAQLLCGAVWSTGVEAPYKATHMNHPCSKWIRENKSNWLWTYTLAIELGKEYTYRYGKKHKTHTILESISCPDLPDGDFTMPVQAMPDEFKDPDSLIAYRSYYAFGKKHLHRWKTRHAWKNRHPPKFIRNIYPGLITFVN